MQGNSIELQAYLVQLTKEHQREALKQPFNWLILGVSIALPVDLIFDAHHWLVPCFSFLFIVRVSIDERHRSSLVGKPIAHAQSSSLLLAYGLLSSIRKNRLNTASTAELAGLLELAAKHYHRCSLPYIDELPLDQPHRDEAELILARAQEIVSYLMNQSIVKQSTGLKFFLNLTKTLRVSLLNGSFTWWVSSGNVCKWRRYPVLRFS